MTNDWAKNAADKYISRTGGAPKAAARLKNPARIGGAFLTPEQFQHVQGIFAFTEFATPKNGARAARRSLAALLGVTEDDLRAAVKIAIKLGEPLVERRD